MTRHRERERAVKQLRHKEIEERVVERVNSTHTSIHLCMKLVITSMGSGKMMVEFFSAEIVFRVWR
jgi:hypothetical protein